MENEDAQISYDADERDLDRLEDLVLAADGHAGGDLHADAEGQHLQGSGECSGMEPTELPQPPRPK